MKMIKKLAWWILRNDLEDPLKALGRAMDMHKHQQGRAMKYWDALTEIENLETPKAAASVRKAAKIAREAKRG